MAKFLAALALIAGASAASAQQISFIDPSDFDPPVTEPQAPQMFKPKTLFGVRAGFAMGTDAEEAVPFIGAGARFPIAEIAAVEITFDYWKDEYAGGDAEVTHMPLMFSGLIYFPLETPYTAPYILAGVGFHNMDFKYSGSLAGETSDTDSEFGFHAGAGLELSVSSFLKVSMDVRWIYIDPDPKVAAIQDEDFHTVQFSFSINLAF